MGPDGSRHGPWWFYEDWEGGLGPPFCLSLAIQLVQNSTGPAWYGAIENTFEAWSLEGEGEAIDQIRNSRPKFYLTLVVIRDRGGSRGRVQGVRTPPEMTCGFLIQLVFCQKKRCGLLVLK